MKRFWTIPFFIFLILLQKLADAQVVTGENAVDLIGKYATSTNLNDPTVSFTKTGSHNAPYYYGLNNPSGFAIDNARHRLFVSDSSNHRVLVFNLTNSNTLLDHIPDFVLGQPDFGSGTLGTTSSVMNAPRALVYDDLYDQLIVADSGNNRILFFDTSNLTSGIAASYVLGQVDFTSSGSGTSSTQFSTPAGLALMPANGPGNSRTLYVSDRANNRVLLFAFAADPTGTAASNVLGQADFSTTTTATPSFQMNGPGGLALDITGERLFVPSFSQNRVMVFDVSSITDGMPPSRILGQPDDTTLTTGNTANKFNLPSSVAYDSIRNKLYVSGVGNRRVTVFDVGTSIADITTGQAATNILGQADYTVTTAQPTRSGLSILTNGKQDLFIDAANGLLYVGQNYHRVSIFDITSITDGENAVDLIGQYDGSSLTNPIPSYTRVLVNDTPNQLGFSVPRSVAIDSVHHRLFVTDGGNNRVLVFNLDSDNLLIDHVPDFVLGQTDFISGTAGSGASGFDLSQSASLFFDSTYNRLFLSVGPQNRILIFDTTVIVNGEAAVHVLGQNDFTTTSNASGTTGLFQPGGMDYDVARDRLFVADDLNQRVLVYLNAGPDDLTDGQAASFVLGQPDFATVTNATTQSKTSRPKDLAYDAPNDRLFVCDMNSRRVLVFDVDPTTIANGQNATNVIGQPDFVTANNSTTQIGMVIPQSLTLDSAGRRLFVLDGSAHRLMVYDTTNLAVAEQPAIAVLGQLDFTTGLGFSGTTASKLNTPNWVEYDELAKRLYVSDSGNHRIMFFASDAPLTYSGSTFTEAPANDGSISTSVNLSILNSRFAITSGALTQGVDYSFSNLPAGLSVSVTVTTATTATVSLTGNATAHENANSVGNFTLTFTDNAFTGRTAANIEGSTKSDLSIQFTNAATPTSTPTATATGNSSVTPMPTNPAQTPTVTPATPPISSVVPTATPLATPRFTPSQFQISARVISKNEPVKDALVYILNLGVAKTDRKGRFSINGSEPGVSYKLLIEHPGTTFSPNELNIRSGEYREIAGESRDYNPRSCEENSISGSLLEAASIVDQLHDRIAKFSEKLSVGGQRINARSMKRLNNYFTASANVPGIILSCKEVADCASINLNELQKKLLEPLENLFHENLSVVRKLQRTGKQTELVSMRSAQKIIRLHKRAGALIRDLPQETGVCD